MTTIDDLYQAIKNIDIKNSPFEGVSYDLTYNDILGLPNGDSEHSESKTLSSDEKFTILSPFAAIPQGEEELKNAASQFIAGKMPIEQSFKSTLREGIKLSRQDDTLFIDLTDLDQASNTFFTEGGANSVAQTIARHLNDPLLKDIKPVIRFLRGTPDQIDDSWWNVRRSLFESIFWPADMQGQPLITHDKAELHIGYYSPSYKMPKQQEATMRGMLLIALWTAGHKLQQANAMLDALFNNVTFSASWNHGKILAVGGKTMMTGGINYWDEYTSAQRKILDMQARVTGDAAISAHKYADYFWKYLNKSHETDTRSFKWSIKLNQPLTSARNAWKPNIVVPIFDSLVKGISKTSGIKVLSVARLGDWEGQRIPDYPVQFIDGLRDLINNFNAPAAIERSDFAGLVRMIQSSADTDGIMGLLRAYDFSPAAWASRTIRVHAVRNAKTSVYMSNQMVVGGLQIGNASYDAMVRNLNSGRTGRQAWDGYIWPYDLLLALADLCLKWRNTADDRVQGIQLVLSGTDAEWGDKRTIRDLFDKIIPLVQGLDRTMDHDAAEALVRKWVLVRRIGSYFGPNSIHTKTVCIDEQLLYIGSDNLYPSYNEEHGIWVEDKGALLDWNTTFWKPMWSKLDLPGDQDNIASS